MVLTFSGITSNLWLDIIFNYFWSLFSLTTSSFHSLLAYSFSPAKSIPRLRVRKVTDKDLAHHPMELRRICICYHPLPIWLDSEMQCPLYQYRHMLPYMWDGQLKCCALFGEFVFPRCPWHRRCTSGPSPRWQFCSMTLPTSSFRKIE